MAHADEYHDVEAAKQHLREVHQVGENRINDEHNTKPLFTRDLDLLAFHLTVHDRGTISLTSSASTETKSIQRRSGRPVQDLETARRLNGTYASCTRGDHELSPLPYSETTASPTARLGRLCRPHTRSTVEPTTPAPARGQGPQPAPCTIYLYRLGSVGR